MIHLHLKQVLKNSSIFYPIPLLCRNMLTLLSSGSLPTERGAFVEALFNSMFSMFVPTLSMTPASPYIFSVVLYNCNKEFKNTCPVSTGMLAYLHNRYCYVLDILNICRAAASTYEYLYHTPHVKAGYTTLYKNRRYAASRCHSFSHPLL